MLWQDTAIIHKGENRIIWEVKESTVVTTVISQPSQGASYIWLPLGCNNM
jgi:hypothetical protein